MRIGLAFTLKSDAADAGRPDDWQEEFDSPATVAAIRSALETLGHVVAELGDGPGLVRQLLDSPPDLVFNFAEGTGVGRGREARVPAACELLGVPYTGSDPATLSVTLDKHWANRIVAAAGVVVPSGTLISPGSALRYHGPFPAIVKPAWEGSSKGVRGRCVIHNIDELQDAVTALSAYEQPILVEEYIAGDELTAGVVGGRVVGIMRVVPRRPDPLFVYSLEVKRDWRNRVDYENVIDAATVDAALTAYDALGCRDLARIDFRRRDGLPYFIEANPLPGLNPDSSDLVILSRLVGVDYGRLIASILDSALARLARTGA